MSKVDHDLPSMTQNFDALRQKYLHLQNEDDLEEMKGEIESSEGINQVSDIENLQKLLQRALNDKEKVSSVSHDAPEQS